MKSRLDQLTIEQFITMAAGDTSVLIDGDENISPDVIKRQAETLIVDYRSIIDPAGTKAGISKDRGKSRRRMKIMLMRICAAMLSIGDDDAVRSILSDYGWSVNRLSSEQVLTKCKTEFGRLEAEEKREYDKENAERRVSRAHIDPRANFAKEVASLMSFYKMSINTAEIKADVYANLVRQAYEQSRKNRAKKK